LSPLKGNGNRLSPQELGLLAKELAAAPDPLEAARIKDRLTRGFVWRLTQACCRSPLRNADNRKGGTRAETQGGPAA